MANRYTDLETFRSKKALLRMERDNAFLRVEQHWNLIRTPETRGILLRDAVGDAIGSWKPVKAIRDVMNGRINANLLSTVGSVYAASRPTWTKRALFSGINWALGKVLGEDVEEGEGSSEKLSGLHAAARTIGSALKRRREKRAARA